MRYNLLFILTLFALEAFPQRQVSGVISDEEDILWCVHIQEEGTDNRNISELDGTFLFFTTNDTCALTFSWAGYLPKTIEITQDTTLHVVMEQAIELDYVQIPTPSRGTVRKKQYTKLLFIGANYEAFNSMPGLVFSNGYDEMPLIHFEDFHDRVIYKTNVQTNFQRDYAFGANVGWVYPFRHLLFVSAGYRQYQYPSKAFSHRDVHVSAARYFKNILLEVQTGYQTLNDSHHWGASAALQKQVVKYRVLVGVSVGYYFDYPTCSVFVQGRLPKYISYRLTYDRIDTFNFFTVGFNYIIYR